MLQLDAGGIEVYNEKTSKFTRTDTIRLEFEHSLASLSKWEAQWEKPFLDGKSKTDEELTSYLNHMLITEYDGDVVDILTQEDIEKINAYISSSQTASSVRDTPGDKGSKETVTSELIYYWMVGLQIPFECENWHLNRLFMLIKIANAKNTPAKKRSKRDIAAQHRELNAQRRAMYNTTG